MIRGALLAATILLALPAIAAAEANPTPPAVTTAAASSVTRTTATITGTVDANGAATGYEVEYGTTASYGLRSSRRDAGAGTAPVSITVPLTGLTANTTYHFRLVATNAAGIRRSADRAFRTKAGRRPAVTLGAAGPITSRAATVVGAVNPRGDATRYFFEYGEGARLDRRTETVAAGDGTVAVPATATLAGLAASTKYRYRLVAVNTFGTTRSARRGLRTPAQCATRYPAKLSIARASPIGGALDVFAPITARASGAASIDYHAAGQHTRFSVAIDAAERRIRFRRSVTPAQARLGTGILTVRYDGDGDTRPQTVRLRAARNQARLDLSRPQLVAGRLLAAGTIDADARGVVRLQLSYQFGCAARIVELRGVIADGRWSIDAPLTPATRAEISARIGAVHSYALFTGYLPARIRGEMRAFQVLGDP